ncbi:hypothetical protein [Denitromonas iodatirespirans]|uniref:VCBS repeat-containing protein n=1 Tax=Denitromonas iodatirespirans TaxID=2795389 RepID=A0A944DFB5_DENI1|nr:hypothetical protein [Denitromonas iodatirespirans]MBT0964041.1 hypothetical protein [Denitromonas iodatirespirans]
MRTCLLTVFMSSVLLGCAAVRAAPPLRAFNGAAFAGLVEASGERGRLDYVLDGANGAELRFASCAEVAATEAAAVREDQFTLFRLLRTNCQALARYADSRPARDSHLPDALTPVLVGTLPSEVLPAVGGQPAPPKAGERLKSAPHVADIEALPGGRVRVLTRDDEIVYTLMAQGDFDGDGVQDMLLRLDWRARDAFGQGVELLQITRRTPGGPAELTWRLPAAP